MAYSTGIMDKRVSILKREEAQESAFAVKTGGQYVEVGSAWANVTWAKGVKSLREGAVDAYDSILVRMRWHDYVTRECRLVVDGVTYQIQSFHKDFREDTIQITAMELQG